MYVHVHVRGSLFQHIMQLPMFLPTSRRRDSGTQSAHLSNSFSQLLSVDNLFCNYCARDLIINCREKPRVHPATNRISHGSSRRGYRLK